MGVLEITAGVVITAGIAVAGWVWKLSSRLAESDVLVGAAEKAAAMALAKATAVGKDLADHKEHVAAEYVSRDAMKEITDAINRLGDRLDSLFLHFMPKPGDKG